MTTAPDPRVLDKRRGERAAEAILAHVRDLRTQADALLTMDITDLTATDVVRINQELKMTRGAVGAAEEFLAKHAVDVWDGKWANTLTVEGVGTARPYRSAKSTTWQHEDLVRAVVQKHLEDAGGEIPDPFTTVRWVTEAAAFDYWRVGVLTNIGIDVDDYREKTPGHIRLQIRAEDQIGATTHGA